MKKIMYKVIIVTLIVLVGVGTGTKSVAADSDPFNGQVIDEWKENRAYNEFDILLTNQWAYDVTSTDDKYVYLNGAGFEEKRIPVWKLVIDESKGKGYVQTIFNLSPEHPNFNELIGRTVEASFYLKHGAVKSITFDLKPGRNMGDEFELEVGDYLVTASLIDQISLDLIGINYADTLKVEDNTVIDVSFNVDLPQTIKDKTEWVEEDVIEPPVKEEEKVEEVKKKVDWKKTVLIVGSTTLLVLGIGGFIVIKKMRED